MHDNKVPDALGTQQRQDLGLLGHRPPGVLVEMPHKKPPKGVLTFAQFLYNQMLIRLRGVIEHVRRGLKRLRMVRDMLRLRGDWFRDTVSVFLNHPLGYYATPEKLDSESGSA